MTGAVQWFPPAARRDHCFFVFHLLSVEPSGRLFPDHVSTGHWTKPNITLLEVAQRDSGRPNYLQPLGTATDEQIRPDLLAFGRCSGLRFLFAIGKQACTTRHAGGKRPVDALGIGTLVLCGP
jgi:hypothetical protein